MAEPAKRGSDEARAWASELAEAFGKAVQLYRKKLRLSAVQLSNRCAEIGYPITRATLAKIETNGRNSKVDIAEVLTLAAALEVTPAALMFPGAPARTFRATPRTPMTSAGASEWFIGSPAYNEFEQLHTPRITQTKELTQAIDDYESAIRGFENRHTIEEAGTAGTFYLADMTAEKNSQEVGPFTRASLSQEYRQISELREQVEVCGGHVELPKWFLTYNAVPF